MSTSPNTIDINYLRLLFEQLGADAFLNNYRKLADFFPALVYVFDADKKRVGYVNKQFQTLLGYTPEDLTDIDYDWNKIIFKDDVEKFNEELQKFYELKDDESHSYDNRLTRKQGDWRYFRTMGTILRRSTDGKPEALLFVAQDITDQLASNDELKRTKELINETESMHRFGMYSYDISADSFTWSDGIYKLFEVNKEEHPSPDHDFYMQFVLPEDKAKIKDIKKNVSPDESEYENEFSIKTKKGNIKILLEIVKVIRNENGDAVKYIGSLRDITKERLYERELQRSIKELNTSNKELEEFAYVASHDMQEPLRKISTFSTRLNDKFSDKLGSEGKIYLDRMNVAATNMRVLIENLLEISRASRNEQPFSKTDLTEIAQLVKIDLELSIEEQEVTISIKDSLPLIEAVPSLMVQLFSNLFNNAIKFRSKEKPDIIVTSRVVDKNEREALLLPEKTFYEIAITDNGIGFEQEFAERIFQIFQRLHGKAEYPGSGIGLSICKKIVDKHGGLLYAKSEPGKGSTFFIILPEKQ